MSYALTALLAALMGLVMGFLGSGGSILTVPTLVYVLGFDPKTAVPLSLVIVGFTALCGFTQRARQGMVSFKSGALFGATGVFGTWAGTKLSGLVTGKEQMVLFALVMVAASGFMLKRALTPPCALKTACRAPSVPRVLALGGIVGALTGLVGVGGGFLVVPALTSLGLDVAVAMGTSLMVITVNCVSGVLSYAGKCDFDWRVAGLFVLVSGTASFGGARLAKNVDGKKMSVAFAVFLLLLGTAILYKNRGVFS